MVKSTKENGFLNRTATWYHKKSIDVPQVLMITCLVYVVVVMRIAVMLVMVSSDGDNLGLWWCW